MKVILVSTRRNKGEYVTIRPYDESQETKCNESKLMLKIVSDINYIVFIFNSQNKKVTVCIA